MQPLDECRACNGVDEACVMKLIIQGMLISLSWTFQSSAVADEPYAPLREEALKIIRTEFPDAAFTKDAEGQYEFKTKTRSFTIYRLDKTGNWQKPSEAEAPDRGGIRVRFFVSKKPWEGALVVPYSGTKDFHVFQVTHVIKNSADGKCHIWAEILTPRIDSRERVKEKLVTLFNDFEKYR